MHFFQVYGVKNAPKILLQKWTPNDLKIIKKIIKCIVRGHIGPQGTPKHPYAKLQNKYPKQRTPGWIFKMFTVGSIFIRFPKLDH